MKSAHPQPRRGFTLIELLLVLALVLTVSVVAWPSIASISHQHALRAAVGVVRSGLETAHLDAISKSARHQVLFDSDGKSFFIKPSSPDSARPLPVGFRIIETTKGPIEFFADGTATQRTLELQSEHGDHATIVVRALTGNAEVFYESRGRR
jgi:prepilin-type N-terminal cleavage/methylation domain-containing protein